MNPHAQSSPQDRGGRPQATRADPMSSYGSPHPVAPSPTASGPYQVLQAQLSPPHASRVNHPSQQQQQQQPPPLTQTTNMVSDGSSASMSAGAMANSSPLTPAASHLAGKVQHLFWSKEKNPNEPNYGFHLTEKLAQQHAQSIQQQRSATASFLSNPQASQKIYQYQVTKLRTWRTGYTRVLALYADSFATLDPETGSETNRWQYRTLSDWLALPNEPDCILLQVGTSSEKLKFCVHGGVMRSMVLTNMLQLQDHSAQLPASETTIVAHVERLTRTGARKLCDIHVKPYGLLEICNATKQTIQVYRFTDVLACCLVAETGLVLTFRQPHKSRLWFLPQGTIRSQVMTRMGEYMSLLGLQLQLQESIRRPEEWVLTRQSINIGAVASVWQVTKKARRHDSSIVGAPEGWVGGIVTRELVVTGLGYLVERDGLGVVSVNRLSDFVAIIRLAESNDVTFEFENDTQKTYTSGNRDALIISILDAAATLGKNTKVCIADQLTRSYRLCHLSLNSEKHEGFAGPASIFQPTSIASHCLKKVQTSSTQTFAFVSGQFAFALQDGPVDIEELYRTTLDACREFNASVLSTGEDISDSGKLEKNISAAVGALWGLVGKLLELDEGQKEGLSIQNVHDRSKAETTAAVLLQTLYRLSQTPTGYKVSVELTTFQHAILQLWTIRDSFCKFCALQVLNILLSGRPSRDLESEYVNKSVIFKGAGQALVDGIVAALVEESDEIQLTIEGNSSQNVSDLVLMAASDILQSVLCTYHDTTAPEYFNTFISSLSKKHRSLLNTLRSHTPCVIENTALLLHLLSTHAPETAAAIRDAALSSSILLHHFYAAIFSPLEGQRFLSRYLCSLWMSGPMSCDEKRLLKRMVPTGFLAYLSMPPLSPMEEDQLDDLEHDAAEENIRDVSGRESVRDTPSQVHSAGTLAPAAAGTNTGRLRKRIAFAAAAGKQSGVVNRQENFRIFFHVLTQDNNIPDLIWNQQTRRELRIALENEIQMVSREIEARGIDAVAWNHQQFRVSYPSLDNEVKVGSVYMRLWLSAGDGFIRAWEEPLHLFELLLRKFLCEIGRDHRVAIMCIRGMTRLYAMHASKIGPVPDIMIFVRSMASTKDIETQHRLLALLTALLGVQGDDQQQCANVPENAEQLLNVESIGLLCQFVAWAHSDVSNVANFMSRHLTSGSGNLPMIQSVDEISSANSTDVARQGTLFPDSSCPPVWFIATGSRIPPPTSVVKGPFRISELMLLMNSDELTSHHLVATTHVERYDSEVASESVDEALIDTGKWKRLHEVWQLRWLLCRESASGSGIYKPTAVALLALRGLSRLVELHRSWDSQGVPYFPIPLAKRMLCANGIDAGVGARHLSILAQSLLCSSHEVVEQAAELLLKVLDYNDEAMPKIYLTGVFFFVCCYTGSNFESLAKLLQATHLKQRFRSGIAATVDGSELRMKERSILGNILPEGLLYVLENYGFERFAEVFVGNVDTPEVIWTFDMRKHLIEMVRQHLGDFPLRLLQNNTAEYSYCPMPGVAYQRLENEIFCHNYYLSNLCNEERFPDWPISDPVEVFKDCLDHFKKQLERDEQDENVAVERAQTVLGLKPGDGTKELRKAYRSLAREYHPDKNPTGREVFESIQAAYELLLPILESGNSIGRSGDSDEATDAASSTVADGFNGGLSQMLTLQLLMKAQIVICLRCNKDLQRYRYPAYYSILQCIKTPKDTDAFESCLLHPKRAAFVATAVELIFRTCFVSPPNADALIQENGVAVLSSILNFYTDACIKDSEQVCNRISEATVASLVGFILRTFSGVAHFASGRIAFAQLECLELCSLNIRRYIDGMVLRTVKSSIHSNSLQIHALECIPPLAKNPEIQAKLIGSGIVWPLLLKILSYDPSFTGESIDCEFADDPSGPSAASSNLEASIAVSALSSLGGYLPETTKNAAMMACLDRLLTAPVAQLLKNRRTGEILRLLNSNTESPHIIWNEAMRKQLVGTLTAIEAERNSTTCVSIDEELSCVAHFEFEALRNETLIGGVYVRIFNKMGSEAVNRIPRPTSFFQEIVLVLAATLEKSLSKAKQDKIKWAEGEQSVAQVNVNDSIFTHSLVALRTLVQSNVITYEVVKDRPCSFPSVLVELFGRPLEVDQFDIVCDVLAVVSSQQEFSDKATQDGALRRLLAILQQPSEEENEDASTNERINRGWSFLEGLVSSPSCANLLVFSNGWLEILGVLAGHLKYTKAFAARLGACRVISRLMWDPLVGATLTGNVERILPPTLVSSLKESPETMLASFDGESDTPELIWDMSMRSELRQALGNHLGPIQYASDCDQCDQPTPTILVKYAVLEKELFIGGVYISRYLKDPTYSLRNPNLFLETLLKRWEEELSNYAQAGSSTVDATDSTAISVAKTDVPHLVTSSIVCICKFHESLCDKLAQYGCIRTSMRLLPGILQNEFTGTPLLCIMRVMHVAVNRLANVEALALTGDPHGRLGIVDWTMQAIGFDALHSESGFLVHMLEKLFKKAIGDTKMNASRHAAFPTPSPAPGVGSVRQKVLSGDDPLAMLGSSNEAPTVASAPGSLSLEAQRQHGNALERAGSIFPPQQLHERPNQAFIHASTGIYGDRRSNIGFSNPLEQPFQPQHQPQQIGPTNTQLQDSSFVRQNVPAVSSSNQYFHQASNWQSEVLQQTSNQQPTRREPRYSQSPAVLNSVEARDIMYMSNGPNQTPLHPQTSESERPPDAQSIPMGAQSFQQQRFSQPTVDLGARLIQQPSNVSPQNHPVWKPESAGLPRNAEARQANVTQPQARMSKAAYGDQKLQSEPNSFESRSQLPSNVGHVGESWDRAQDRLDGLGVTTLNNSPVVQTVGQLQYQPDGVHGNGIDARSKDDPHMTAYKQSVSVKGAPNSAQGRVALLQQALGCNLCQFLLERIIENPQLQDVNDPTAAKTYAIDLLKTLTTDPGFGMKFKLILDEIPAWKKYELQDHSLSMAGRAPRAEYLLTGESLDTGRLLTDG